MAGGFGNELEARIASNRRDPSFLSLAFRGQNAGIPMNVEAARFRLSIPSFQVNRFGDSSILLDA